MTKVSIIVPFHNVEQYISQCIESLIHQTLQDIEIICIDDASDDKSVEIVESYINNDSRIKLLHTGSMSGQSYARNMGLEIAKGEYVGFVDSDDWVEAEMFEKMYKKAAYEQTDITMCMAKLYDDKEGTTYTDDYYSLKSLEKFGDKIFNANESKDEILNINVVLWNKIYKRTFLQINKAKFANGYIYEDLLFFFETYIKAEKINIVWEYLYYYRQNRKFSTMQNSDKKVYDRIPMVEETYKVLQSADFFAEKKPEIVSWIVDDIFHRYTVLEDKYYEEYYKRMQEFFRKIDATLTQEDKEVLAKSYCNDEFRNVVERTYFGFWNFLIEKYKTSNKRIKAAEHKCNLDILAIKEYLEEYKKEAAEDKKSAIDWWENHYNEEIKRQEDDFNSRMVTQEYALKSWQAESVKQATEKLKADYEWKIEDLKRHYEESLQNQKYYYENNFLLVKIVLKCCKKYNALKNRVKKIFKKN